jgi:cytochrome c oxidase subunit 2
MIQSRAVILATSFLLGLLILLAPWPGILLPAGAREVRVRAAQYAYAPGVIRVTRGDRVTLVLEAEDVTHGLHLDGYAVNLVAVPGRATRATFVADRPGKFRMRCSKVCGSLHPFMLGELVVEPNSPFGRAAALAILAAVGSLLFLRAGRRGEEAA